MPLDPSIIGSYNPGAGVNVNALMQQQMQGMENINALERQRQADALAMEDRAVLQQERAAAAEEKAMIEALLPAYTYGIETGDMAGALNLVPPDMQEGILPYVQALQGKSPEQVRAALIGSLSTSKAGQEALAAMQRAQTAQIQFGQLTLAQQEAQRKADEAALGPQPEPMSEYQKAQIEIEREKLAAAQEGKGKTETAAEVKARLAEEKRTKDIAFAVEQVEAAAAKDGLLDQATGSYFGNLIDTTAQVVGYGTPGAIANAKMKPIADLVLKLVPRFEGPQAIPDVQSYKEAAGDLANPNLPTSVKKAAAAEIVRLLKAYPGQFDYSSAGAGAGEAEGAGGAETGETTLQYDADGNLIE